MTLYHYTCAHGRAALGKSGTVLPIREWNRRAARRVRPDRRAITEISWFTDLDGPGAEALGLTRHASTCDRTAFRYRVRDEDAGLVVPWVGCAWRQGWMLLLERADGALPRHWFVSPVGVRVTLDPVAVRP